MNHKVWLIAFGVVAALLIGGAGFYAFSSYGKYSEEMSGWSSRVGTIESLEKRVPFPNKENSELLAAKVSDYEESVRKLYQGLKSFQRPLNTQIQGTNLAPKIKQSVQDFREFAKNGGLVIEGTEEFQLGLDAYNSSIPAPEVVPILDYKLEAIDHLLRELVNSGVATLLSFERDSIPGETGYSGEHESGVVHKYPVRMRFQGTHTAFLQFVNKISNDKDYFYIVRVLKVQNEATDGPPKQQTQEFGFGTGYVHAATGEEPTEQELVSWGYGTAPEAEVAAAAQAAGFVTRQDARVLMGQELLEVYMLVDIVRFVDPREAAENNADESKEESSKKR